MIVEAARPVCAAAASEFRLGWKVVLSSAVGLGLGITGLPLYGMGQFIRPLSEEFGWSRAAIASAAFYLALGTVLTAPLIGRVVDRIGVRPVAITSLIAAAAGMLLLTVNRGSLTYYYAAWIAVSLLGCGTTPVIWTRAINSWFNRQRGLALGIALCGTGLSALAAPVLLSGVIARFGWRGGFEAEAGALLAVALPLVWWLFSEQAEAAATPENPARGNVAEMATTLRQAVRGTVFWRLLVGIFALAVTIAGMIVHLVPLLADRGVARAEVVQAMSLLGFAIIAGRLSIGFLLDRMPAPLLALLVLNFPAAACLVLLGHGPAAAVTVMLGFATGADTDLLPYLTSRSFGLRSYAELFGCLLSAASLGGGLGPILAGWVHDQTGSYNAALYAGVMLSASGAVLIGSIRLPAARPEPDAVNGHSADLVRDVLP